MLHIKMKCDVTSKQSFFLCVIAPQFSHAPLRYFVAREACISQKIITANHLSVHKTAHVHI